MISQCGRFCMRSYVKIVLNISLFFLMFMMGVIVFDSGYFNWLSAVV